MFPMSHRRWCFAVAVALLSSAPAHSAAPPTRKPKVELRLQYAIEHGLEGIEFAISPNSKILALAGDSRKKVETGVPVIQFRSLDSGKVQREIVLPGHRLMVTALRFSPNGKWLVATTGDGTIEIWEVATGKGVKKFSVSAPRTLNFSPDGKQLVVGCSTSGKLHLWETTKWTSLPAVPVHGGKDLGSWVAAFSPDGRRFAVVLDSGTVHIWDCPRWKHASSIDAAIQAPDIIWKLFFVGLQFTPDSRSVGVLVRQLHRLLVFGDDDFVVPARGVTLYDVRTGKMTSRFGFQLTGAHSFVFSRDGRLGISCGLKSLSPDSGQITVTDLKSEKVLLSQACSFEALPRQMLLSPDGRTLVVERVSAPFLKPERRSAGCVLVWQLQVRE